MLPVFRISSQVVFAIFLLCCQGLLGMTVYSFPEKESRRFVKHSLSPGLIMAGYQGWFNAPGDGAGRGWYHYSKEGKFEPGYAKVDMWPEMSEYEKAYPTAFRFADGSAATTFSSFDESTVRLHFRWMQSFGIDGVYLQRFVAEIKNESGRKHFNKVMTSAARAALDYDRTLAVMYDLSGMRSDDTDVLIADWKMLMAQFGFTQRSRYANYLHHGNRPVVAIWGVGFNDNRKYTLSDIEKLIRFFHSDQGGHCSVMLGVPTYWRQQGNDCIKDPHFLEVVQMADIVHPWFVGRFNEAGYDAFRPLIGEDLKWCNAHRLAYVPVVFPGFSWNNMYPDSKNSFVARNRGSFFWKQLAGASAEGAEMIYVAMFDEIDEGTAIFKCAHTVPVAEGNRFVPLDPEVRSDHYLWLTGKAGAWLKKRKTLPQDKPIQPTP